MLCAHSQKDGHTEFCADIQMGEDTVFCAHIQMDGVDGHTVL